MYLKILLGRVCEAAGYFDSNVYDRVVVWIDVFFMCQGVYTSMYLCIWFLHICVFGVWSCYPEPVCVCVSVCTNVCVCVCERTCVSHEGPEKLPAGRSLSVFETSRAALGDQRSRSRLHHLGHHQETRHLTHHKPPFTPSTWAERRGEGITISEIIEAFEEAERLGFMPGVYNPGQVKNWCLIITNNWDLIYPKQWKNKYFRTYSNNSLKVK